MRYFSHFHWLTQKQYSNYLKQNASDIFLKNNSISFGNTDGAITGGFCGYLLGTVAALAAVAAAPAEAAAEGPTSVSVILSNFGEAKTAVIKVVKEITGLGLVEAKGLVDKCPSPIKENISVEEAEEIKKKLLDAGASVDIK